MKRIFLLAFIIVISACNNTVVHNNNDTPKKSHLVICEFYPVDFYKTELNCHGNMTQYSYALVLEPLYTINNSSDYTKYRLKGETYEAKAKELADSLRSRGYHLNFMIEQDDDIIISMMYGGVSDQPRIYSSKEFAGIPAGNSLSDCFELISSGEIQYPEMSFIDKGNRQYGSMLNVDIDRVFSFEDYFFPGRVVTSLRRFYNIGIFIKEEYTKYLTESITFNLEIPVTGLNSNGEETTVVFTAELPAVPAS